MYSSAFCSVGLQAYNLKTPNLSLDEVYNQKNNIPSSEPTYQPKKKVLKRKKKNLAVIQLDQNNLSFNY
jgi:hypothetical protein